MNVFVCIDYKMKKKKLLTILTVTGSQYINIIHIYNMNKILSWKFIVTSSPINLVKWYEMLFYYLLLLLLFYFCNVAEGQ